MLVPQAMAYAELGGLPPSAGFRAALIALPLYALIGTSRHLGIGPEPGTAVLAALAVGPLAAGDPDRYLVLMAALAGLVGAMALLAGLLRLGFIADLLSKPVLVGYITGVGLTLLSSQLGAFTSVSITEGDFFPRFAQFFRGVSQLDPATTAIGVTTLLTIVGLRRVAPTIPGALLGLVGSMVAVAVLDLDIRVVGEVQASLPSPAVPVVSFDDLRQLLGPAAGLVLIGYTDNILTARSIASKQRYKVDANRELLALGAVNAGAALGGGFPMSSSASRSIVPASLGAKSQLSSLVSFTAVVVFLLFGRDLLAEIPRSALAAVVVAAALAVIDIEGFRRLSEVSLVEAGLAAVTCLAIITTDLLFGVLVAVGLSGIVTLQRVARPHDAILGDGVGLDGWIDMHDTRAKPEPGLLVYRFDGPLFFGNAEHYRQRLASALEANPGVEHHVVLDFEGVGSIDATAADHLIELHRELSQDGVSLAVARANADVIEIMNRSGLADRLGHEHIHLTINGAVADFRQRGTSSDESQ